MKVSPKLFIPVSSKEPQLNWRANWLERVVIAGTWANNYPFASQTNYDGILVLPQNCIRNTTDALNDEIKFPVQLNQNKKYLLTVVYIQSPNLPDIIVQFNSVTIGTFSTAGILTYNVVYQLVFSPIQTANNYLSLKVSTSAGTYSLACSKITIQEIRP